MALIAIVFLNFDLPSAVLLGAVLAPTDPVLAADVQVGPPNEGDEDEVHFALTAEAGMNDGVAFPFTWLAIALALSVGIGDGLLLQWVWKDLFYRMLAGIIVGYAAGHAVYYLFFTLPDRKQFKKVQNGFVAIATTLFVYGLTELFQGYGFIAVFVAAVTIRNKEMTHNYHLQLHEFTEQVERILLVILLILFGGSLVHGLLDHLTWPMAVVGIVFLLVIRPLSAIAGLAGIPIHFKRKGVISFFGIRGIGSFFYLSFALSKAEFAYKDEIWSLVAFIVLVSIIMHGLTAAKGLKLISNDTK
jgi:NhaP-type Na+/H+ or K+/H+ antiporter